MVVRLRSFGLGSLGRSIIRSVQGMEKRTRVGPYFGQNGRVRFVSKFLEAPMSETARGQQRAELHETIWSIADDLRGSVDIWDWFA